VKLSEIEIVAQSFLFLIAGYETSATTLHFALFLIALHPDIQRKCVEEVCNVIGDSVCLIIFCLFLFINV
jgi:cytochrome P450